MASTQNTLRRKRLASLVRNIIPGLYSLKIDTVIKKSASIRDPWRTTAAAAYLKFISQTPLADRNGIGHFSSAVTRLIHNISVKYHDR